jgi:hypothetical protein
MYKCQYYECREIKGAAGAGNYMSCNVERRQNNSQKLNKESKATA